jgi:hypothetical protein
MNEESIRKFVKIQNDQQIKSDIFENILQNTNYRLPIQRLNIADKESQEILKRIKKEWSENELQWRNILLEQENIIKCKATKVSPGSFVYHDTNTGNSISLLEYESRYMEYANRCKSFKKYINTSIVINEINSNHVSVVSANLNEKTISNINNDINNNEINVNSLNKSTSLKRQKIDQS